MNTISLLPGLGGSLRALQAELDSKCTCAGSGSVDSGTRKKTNLRRRQLQSVSGSVTDGNRLELDFNVDYGVAVQSDTAAADVFTAAVTGVATALTSDTAAAAIGGNLETEVAANPELSAMGT